MIIEWLGVVGYVAAWVFVVVSIADLTCGLVHWWEDTYGQEHWPLIGPAVIAPNRLHHLAPRAFVMPWLVIVYYRQGARQHSLFILPDMLPADTFRRLRVRLKTELGQARPPTRTCSRTS